MVSRLERPAPIRIGTAGWSVAPAPEAFRGAGSHLARYAGRLNAVEINSSFYRPHRRSTYERWAASVPDGFAFAVKVPRHLTHERRLVDCAAAIGTFADGVAGLGAKLGVLLVQLPPSLAFDAPVAGAFLAALQEATGAALACEPRHRSWFAPEAEALLAERRIARVAADPAVVPAAAAPGGWEGLAYLRLHGAPRIYHSDYADAALAALADRLAAAAARGARAWCVFDNTAEGHALRNALALGAALVTAPPTSMDSAAGVPGPARGPAA